MPSTELVRDERRREASLRAHWHVMRERLWAARWAWCLGLVVVVAARHFAGPEGYPLATVFANPDDAVRLIQVREFLAGAGWFDTLLPAVGAPEGLQSHWSRLIDAPLAALVLAFGLVTSAHVAELAAQILWPLVILLVLARVMVAEAERRAGPLAGLVLLALVVASPTAPAAFLPGRIDHHNLQIACAVIATYLLARSLTAPRAGGLAGAVMALGLVIGLEALPLMAVILAGACFIACFDKGARAGTVNALATLFAGLVAGFVATVPPWAWGNVVCDALSLNLLGLAGCGAAAGLLLRRIAPEASPLVWIAGYAVAALAGLASYLAANPACAGGAFSDVDPMVQELWLANVIESLSLLRLSETLPTLALSYVAFVAIAAVAAIHQAWRTRGPADIFIAAATVLAALYGFYFVKFMSYGVWIGLVPLAAAIARLPGLAGLPARTVRIAGLLTANQATLLAVSGLVLSAFTGTQAAGSGAAPEALASNAAACFHKSDIEKLRRLPPGLVVANLDLSPFIALATPHRVAAGPYHRIHPAIRRQFQALLAPVDDAERRLRDIGADYLVLCLEPAADGAAPADASTFSEYLRRGGAPPFLERIDLGATLGPLEVWKLRRGDG